MNAYCYCERCPWKVPVDDRWLAVLKLERHWEESHPRQLYFLRHPEERLVR